jgi:diacylglycerol kinase family enzyme
MVPSSQCHSWVGIVANQNSGIGRGRQRVAELARALSHSGFGALVAWTTEERASLVRRAKDDPGCRCLVAVGGDGTVSALLNERPKVPVTVFPAGTENLVAQQLGLRRDPLALARTIARGERRWVDVGSACGRRFLLMVGFGFDGEIVSRHHRERLSHTGLIRPTSRLAYVLPVLHSSFSYKFPIITARIDNQGVPEVLSGTTVFVFNAPRYALGLPFVPSARDDDGWLDLLIFRDPGALKALYYLWKVFRGAHLDLPGVVHRRVKTVVVTASDTVPVQIDGDPGGFLQKDSDPEPAGTAESEPSGSLERDRGLDGPMNAKPASGWTIEIIPQAVEVYTPRARS